MGNLSRSERNANHKQIKKLNKKLIRQILQTAKNGATSYEINILKEKFPPEYIRRVNGNFKSFGIKSEIFQEGNYYILKFEWSCSSTTKGTSFRSIRKNIITGLMSESGKYETVINKKYLKEDDLDRLVTFCKKYGISFKSVEERYTYKIKLEC